MDPSKAQQQPGMVQGGTGSVPAGAVPTGAAPSVQQPASPAMGGGAPQGQPKLGGTPGAPQTQVAARPGVYNPATGLGMGPGQPGSTPPPTVTGTGGTPLPVDYQTPIGPVEQFMQGLLRQPTSNSFVDSLASGQIPAATLAQFRNEQARSGAQLAEQSSGARFGSDYAGAFGRQQGQALTALGAQSEQQALAARQAQIAGQAQQYGLGGTLLGSETQRSSDALRSLLQEYGGSTGLPPQISALLGLLGVGGGSTTGAGTAGKFL